MKQICCLILLSFLGLYPSFLFSDNIEVNNNTFEKKYAKIYIIDIKEEIAPRMTRKLIRGFAEAQKWQANLILIDMNTYGGLLADADSIRTKILNSKIPVYAFINNNAASAGALISIACHKIYMTKGANIGAATVVDQQGEVVPDKYQSYMRSLMRSTAEARGRNPKIAEAMVDPSIKIEGIVDSGKVLTFSTSEAIKHGFCDGEAQNTEDLLKKIGTEKFETRKYKATWLDNVIGFLTNPAVSGVLILIIIGGVYFEMQTPGIGFPLLAAVLAAILYFAPLYLDGLAANWEILIFIAGVLLLGLEIFAIPGFGVAGIAGILLIIAGLTLSLVNNVGFNFQQVSSDKIVQSLFLVIVSIVASVVVSIFVGGSLINSKAFSRLMLNTTQDKEKGYVATNVKVNNLIGKTGTAYTVLRPSGKVLIDDEIYDAVAEAGYIDKDDSIQVISQQTYTLVVRKKEA